MGAVNILSNNQVLRGIPYHVPHFVDKSSLMWCGKIGIFVIHAASDDESMGVREQSGRWFGKPRHKKRRDLRMYALAEWCSRIVPREHNLMAFKFKRSEHSFSCSLSGSMAFRPIAISVGTEE